MTENSSLQMAPKTIEKLADGAMAAFALLAGMQLDLFSALERGPKRAEEIAKAIDVNPEKLKLLLYALVVAGMLTVDSELFGNTPESDHYLVKGRSNYIGGRHKSFMNAWQDAFNTAESVRTGVAQSKLDFGSMSSDEMEAFLRGLHPGAMASGRNLLQKFDFSSYRKMLEVGAGLGGLTLVVAEDCPDIQAVLVDFPAVMSIAQKVIDEAALADRVKVLPGDATTDPLGGPFDVAVMRAFIQVLGPEEAQQALTNIGQAIEPGGAIYIIGKVIDDTRTEPEGAALFNVIFLNHFDGGQAYTRSEYHAWLDNAGFDGFHLTYVPSGDSIVSARKRP